MNLGSVAKTYDYPLCYDQVVITPLVDCRLNAKGTFTRVFKTSQSSAVNLLILLQSALALLSTSYPHNNTKHGGTLRQAPTALIPLFSSGSHNKA